MLTATLYHGMLAPENVTNSVKWTSSNAEIAVVDATGILTGKEEGTVTITAEYQSEDGQIQKTATKEFTVEYKAGFGEGIFLWTNRIDGFCKK